MAEPLPEKKIDGAYELPGGGEGGQHYPKYANQK